MASRGRPGPSVIQRDFWYQNFGDPSCPRNWTLNFAGTLFGTGAAGWGSGNWVSQDGVRDATGDYDRWTWKAPPGAYPGLLLHLLQLPTQPALNHLWNPRFVLGMTLDGIFVKNVAYTAWSVTGSGQISLLNLGNVFINAGGGITAQWFPGQFLGLRWSDLPPSPPIIT